MLAYNILEWLVRMGEVLIVANLLALVTGALAKRIRRFSAILLFVSAQFWAFTLTAWCAVTVYSGWGLFLTMLGPFLGIVGIIPVALFCLLISRSWLNLAELLFQIALVVLGYVISSRMMHREGDR